MNRRIKAAGWHFLGSAVLAIATALLVFLLWYPPPYAAVAGGLVLFGMLAGIDVVLGPCLTGLIASPKKPLKELRRDIAVIVLVQLIALGYGLHAIALARPVHLVFEADRFVVVASADIEAEQLAKAPEGLRTLPWTGPTVLGTELPTNPDERLNSLNQALQGRDVAMQPEHWVEFSKSIQAVMSASREVERLLQKYPQLRASAQELATRQGLELNRLRYLPLVTRQDDWVVLVAGPDARIVGFFKADGFF